MQLNRINELRKSMMSNLNFKELRSTSTFICVHDLCGMGFHPGRNGFGSERQAGAGSACQPPAFSHRHR